MLWFCPALRSWGINTVTQIGSLVPGTTNHNDRPKKNCELRYSVESGGNSVLAEPDPAAIAVTCWPTRDPYQQLPVMVYFSPHVFLRDTSRVGAESQFCRKPTSCIVTHKSSVILLVCHSLSSSKPPDAVVWISLLIFMYTRHHRRCRTGCPLLSSFFRASVKFLLRY
jgi:hypothetical protein